VVDDPSAGERGFADAFQGNFGNFEQSSPGFRKTGMWKSVVGAIEWASNSGIAGPQRISKPDGFFFFP